ncbi:hypothetical protein Tco_0027462 [Tanacetum coccineum]
MSDALFDVSQNANSAKELWDQIESKYMTADASSKKFLVSNFNITRWFISRSEAKYSSLSNWNRGLHSMRRYSVNEVPEPKKNVMSSVSCDNKLTDTISSTFEVPEDLDNCLSGLKKRLSYTKDDEEDVKSSEEYLRDLDLKFHERALLAGKVILHKIVSLKRQSLYTDLQTTLQGLTNFNLDEEEVTPDDDEMVQVKVLMDLSEDENMAVDKNHARNGEWVNITMRKAVNKSLGLTEASSEPESSKESRLEPHRPQPHLKILQGAHPNLEVTPMVYHPHSLRERYGLVPTEVKTAEHDTELNELIKLVQMLNEQLNSSKKALDPKENSYKIQGSKDKASKNESLKSVRLKP